VILGLNDTDNPPTRLCPLEDVCGFGGFHDEKPNQWFRYFVSSHTLSYPEDTELKNHRFITPVFLHAGIIHFVLNMLAQLTASAEVSEFI
jgi:membrane associated rhomboid family serine protease